MECIPAFIPELNYVMEEEGKLVGQNMFMRTMIVCDDGRTVPVLTMGPIGITPELKRKGYGKSGFTYAREFGIRYHDLPEGADDSFFLCKELIPGYLREVTGVYQTPKGYYVKDEEVEEFDRQFPAKEKLKLPGQLW